MVANADDTERKVYSISEVAALLHIARGSAYSAVRSGELPSIKIGRRLIVPAAALDRLLESAGSK